MGSTHNCTNTVRPLLCSPALALLLLLSFSVGGTGCASPPLTHGIPNFSQVAPGIYCGGQPTDAGWLYLTEQLHLENDIVLNSSSDESAARLGMSVRHFPITAWQQQFGPVDIQLESAYLALVIPQRYGRGVYVHCTKGANRTRTLIILYRCRECGWTKSEAIAEANQYGWSTSWRALKTYIAQGP